MDSKESAPSENRGPSKVEPYRGRRQAVRTPKGLRSIRTPRDKREQVYSYSSYAASSPGSTDDESKDEDIVPQVHARKDHGVEHFPTKELQGKYKFVRYLGHGSYGHVCEAVKTSNNIKVAIKKVPKIFDNDVDAKRLLRELRILRTLRNHEAIIDILDILPPKDLLTFNSLSIIFEFVDTDLAKLIASEQFFTTLHVQYMVYQILLGLKYMHSARIAHRDLKPANILVNEDCSLKICDFGLARGMLENFKKPNPVSIRYLAWPKNEDEKENSPRSDARSKKKAIKSRQLTRHVVTRWYRAPEIILLEQQRDQLMKVDMWAVGCIIGELLLMIKENEPVPGKRKPMFPGSSCFPLSAQDPFAYQDRLDQLNVIFEVIGTPNKEEIKNLQNEKARIYLKSIPKKQPKKLTRIFKGPGQSHAIDMVKGLLQFDPRKRFNVSLSLKHPFLRNVRDEEAERRHRPARFDFEDIPLTKRTIKELIIDEILIWNPTFLKKPKINGKELAELDEDEKYEQ